MEKRYEIFEHTADIGIIAYGDKINKLFENAAYGMFSLITDIEKIKIDTTKTYSIELYKTNLEELLVSFLSELLYKYAVEEVLFKEFRVNIEDNFKLKSEASGELYDEKRHHIKKEIKTVTYHMLEIKKINNLWSARVVFDV